MELRKQIEAFQKQFLPNVPAETLATMQGATDDLVRSGIAQRSIKEGVQAPDFTLPNARGEAVTLSDVLAKGPAVVTFYRGAWCPYCNLQLRAYQQLVPDLRALGASLVAISPQTPDNSLTTAQQNALEYDVLSDLGNRVARRYRLVFSLAEPLRGLYQQLGIDLPKYNGNDSYELPMPGTFVIDRSGVVRLAFVDADYSHRLEPVAILKALRPHA